MEQVAEALRLKIVSGAIKPGSPLGEGALAASAGVSRNTMREVIRQLAREGLVTHHMHRGALVVLLTARDAEDIFRVRRTLELTALEATARLGRDELSGLADAVEQIVIAARGSVWGDIVDADLLFHSRLVAVLGSHRIDRFYRGVEDELRLCLSIVDREDEEPAAIVAEHQELLQLILDGEQARCAEIMAGHLAESEERLKRILPADSDALLS